LIPSITGRAYVVSEARLLRHDTDRFGNGIISGDGHEQRLLSRHFCG
jgi:proline racemase